MIYNKVDENGRVKIRHGDEAALVAGSSGLGHNPEFVNAFYFGWTPETSKLCGYPYDGEGHLFVRPDKEEGLVFYIASSLKMAYWSDGDDKPSYAVGISAWKTNGVNLSPLELEYVHQILEKRSAQPKAA